MVREVSDGFLKGGRSIVHYFPVSASIILLFVFLFVFLVSFIEIGILGYAYHRIGIGQRYLFLVMFLSLFGSYINIPLFELPPEQMVMPGYVDYFGIRHMIPVLTEGQGTVVAINFGGAVIPSLVSVYLTVKNRFFGTAMAGVAIVAVLVHMMAAPVRGVGIAVPIFIPPIAATIVAVMLSRRYAPALAYVSGCMGTLLGADILNLGKIGGLGAPVASIGGAGTFDGVFLTGILAVLFASVFVGKSRRYRGGAEGRL